MNIAQMHYEFKLQLDQIDSLESVGLNPVEIDTYIQKGISLWVKDRWDNAGKVRGFETDQKRTDNLKSLHVHSPAVQPILVPTSVGNGYYELKLSALLYPYMFLTAADINIQKGTCIKTAIRQTAYHIDDKKDYYNKPSFAWERVLTSFGKSSSSTDGLSSLFFDTGNDFIITGVAIDYVKKPNIVFFGGYNSISGQYQSTDPQVSCDIDPDYHDEIIRLAVKEAYTDLQNQQATSIKARDTEADKN